MTNLQSENQTLTVKVNANVAEFQDKEAKIQAKAYEQAKEEFDRAAKKASDKAYIDRQIEQDKRAAMEQSIPSFKRNSSQGDLSVKSVQATTRSYIMEKLKNQQLK